MIVDILTINMSGNNGNVEERYGELDKYVQTTRPDILAAQEVSVDVGVSALTEIATDLGNEYGLVYETTSKSKKGQRGQAIVSKLPIIRKNIAEFSVPGKKALVSELSTGDEDSLIVANVHLDAHPIKEKNRRIKLKELAQSLENDFAQAPKIIAGDFNSLPFYPCLNILRNSGFRQVKIPKNDQRANFTFPSSWSREELTEQGFMQSDEVRTLRRFAWLPGIKKSPLSGLPSYIIDYIFLSEGIEAVSSSIIEKARADAPPISDHCGIQATLKIA